MCATCPKNINYQIWSCRGGVGEDGREAAWGGGGVWRLQASDDPQGEYFLSVMCDGNGDDCKLQTIQLINDFSSVWYVLLSSDGLLLSEHTAGHPQHLRAGNCQRMLLRFIEYFNSSRLRISYWLCSGFLEMESSWKLPRCPLHIFPHQAGIVEVGF